MKMMKRALSLLMCIIMVFGMLPMEAISVTMDENGTPVYQIGDSVWVRGEDADPAEVCAPDTFWLPAYENEQPVTRQGLCQMAEHAHVFVCPEDCQLVHEHEENCYAQVYTGCILHTHDENCVKESVYTCGQELHENHDGCTASQVCKVEVHDHATMNCTTEVRFTCTEEHEHSLEAECAHETVYTCGKENHAHGEAGCEMTTVYDCGKEIHNHENCTTEEVYTDCVEHAEHDENCTSEQKLSCGKEAHICVTEGCAADCAIEEHTHTDECDMEGVYYKWTVVEDTSSTLENDRGLPLHFFIAEPGEAIDPDGSYVNYKQSYWGSNNDRNYTGAYSNITQTEINNGKYPQIKTELGIRNVSDEGIITPYIYKLPDAFTSMADFKDFGSISITDRYGRTTTYYDTEYEIKWVTICYRSRSDGLGCYCGVSYNHIHIDGVLSKKIVPAELNLTKRIPAAAANQETFNFKLTKLQHNSAGNPTQNVDTSFGSGGSITLTATIPAGATSADIVSPIGTTINFGYYMLEEVSNDRWQTSGIVIDRSGSSADMNLKPGPVYIYIAPDGTLKYSSTYNGTYATANEIFVDNERKNVAVTYTWEGIPEGLTPLPESSTVKPGTIYGINTSYPIGTRVRGTGTNAGKYYEFMGWQYYDSVGGERQYITYQDKVMDPSTITVNSNTNIHGLWTEHDLPRADGYITITKTFVNKPVGAEFANFYIAVIHGGTEYDVTPNLVGEWNADHTQWTYHHPISKSGEYTVVEGKYDVAGYTVTPAVTVIPVAGISDKAEATDYESTEFVSDGHKYKEIGKKVTIDLPFDTSVVTGASGQADEASFHAATVNFTNTYTKKTIDDEKILPNLRVRKWDGNFYNTLTGATYELTGFDGTVEAVGDTTIYKQLQPDTSYTLKETQAPEGYEKDETLYTVKVVTDGEAVEELRAACGENHAHTTACYAFVKVQKYTIEVPGADGTTLPGVFNPDPQVLRLNIPNEQIKADLNISKTFNDNVNGTFTPTAGTVLVDIYGPVAKDTNGEITDVGPLVHTRLPITGENGWKLTVEGLPYGEYFVEEIMASIHGYTWTGATFSGGDVKTVGDHVGVVVDVSSTVDINLSIQNQYEIWKSADFFILKENLNGDELSGAKFELFDGETNVTDTYLDTSNGYGRTTNVNGLMHFRGFELEAGQTSKTFTLKETQAPSGYYLIQKEYTVTVTLNGGVYDITIKDKSGSEADWDHDDDLLTVINNPILGQITVVKDYSGVKSTEKLESVTFTLQSANGTLRRTATVAEKDEWTHTFTDLPLGQYTLTETYASIPGYTYTTKYQVNNGAETTGTAANVTLSHDPATDKLTTGIPTSANAEVTFTNTYVRQEIVTVNADSFTVFKRDEKGEDLAGAKFGLFADAECKTLLTDVPFAVEATSDQYGQARFTGLKLENGDALEFYMKETAAPVGYVLGDTIWKIKLDDDIKIEVLNDKNIFETVVDWITSLWKPKDGTEEYEWVDLASLAVTNQRIKGDLTITKTFTGVDTSALTNARVEVHVHGPIKRENGQITDIGPLVETVTLTGSKLSDVVEDLEVGEYVLREPFASIHGYTWNGVTYSGEGIETVQFNNMNFALFEVSKDVDHPEISVSLTNSYTKWKAADFTINKVKSLSNLTDGLAGAKFQLYSNVLCREEDKVTSTEFTTEATTGIAGYATFSGFTVEAGQTVTYYLKEVTAPNNYYLGTTVWKVTIDHTETEYDVTITLADPDNSTATSGDGWEWKHDRDTLNVQNTEILGSITITKEFPAKQPVESVNVRVVGPNGYSQNVTLGKQNEASEPVWSATLSGLHMGDYYILEQNAAVEGYTLFTEYFEGNNKEMDGNKPAEFAHVTLAATNYTAPSVDVTIENSYYENTVINTPTQLTIRKTDENGKGLSGAVFTLSYDGNTQEYTTQNGEVKIDLVGNGTLTGQSGRTYTLTETAAPTGHEIGAVNQWTIEVVEDDGKVVINLNKTNNTYENIWDWIVGQFTPTWDASNKILTVVNNRKTVPITVEKVVTGLENAGDDAYIKDLKDAEYKFELYIEGDKVDETVTIAAGEKATFETHVPYGSTYEVKEVVAEDAAFTSTLTNASGTVDATDLDGITVTATNTYTIQNGDALKISITKVSTGKKATPLSGALFALYNSEGTLMDIFESDKNGKFQITKITEPGEYTLKETAAPKGYYKLDKPITITAEYDYEVTTVDGKPVIVRTLTATVAGKTVYDISANSYGVKNTPITETPKTGDDTDLLLWGGMTTISLLCMAMMILFFPVKKGKYQR